MANSSCPGRPFLPHLLLQHDLQDELQWAVVIRVHVGRAVRAWIVHEHNSAKKRIHSDDLVEI